MEPLIAEGVNAWTVYLWNLISGIFTWKFYMQVM